jgi:hypothetical protein
MEKLRDLRLTKAAKLGETAVEETRASVGLPRLPSH